jgi:hypothetical protein
MPVYVYEDQESKVIVEVIRSFDEYEKVPEREEVGDLLTDEQFTLAVWKRIVSSKISVSRAPGWGHGRKGYWTLFFMISGGIDVLSSWI